MFHPLALSRPESSPTKTLRKQRHVESAHLANAAKTLCNYFCKDDKGDNQEIMISKLVQDGVAHRLKVVMTG